MGIREGNKEGKIKTHNQKKKRRGFGWGKGNKGGGIGGRGGGEGQDGERKEHFGKGGLFGGGSFLTKNECTLWMKPCPTNKERWDILKGRRG